MNKRARLVVNRGAASLVALGLLAACVRTLAPLDPETQAACIREAGITGSYSVTATLLGDRMTYVVGPGPGVTQAQTDIANACIARTIGDGTPGSATVSSSAIAPSSSRPVSDIGSQCSKGGGPMQGGAGYC